MGDSRFSTARHFVVADLSPKGELQLKADYEYEQLELIPGAADLIGHFSGALWRSPEEFESPLPDGRRHMVLRWRASASTAGIATLRWHDTLASTSLLATGKDEAADRLTLAAAQTHLLRELHDTGFEPAFGLIEIPERPLLATINLQPPDDRHDRIIAALADRCFAAAYFRFQGLV